MQIKLLYCVAYLAKAKSWYVVILTTSNSFCDRNFDVIAWLAHLKLIVTAYRELGRVLKTAGQMFVVPWRPKKGKLKRGCFCVKSFGMNTKSLWNGLRKRRTQWKDPKKGWYQDWRSLKADLKVLRWDKQKPNTVKPVNRDSEGAIELVRIKGVSVLSGLNLEEV